MDTWLRGQAVRTFFDRSELAAGLPWITALEQAIGQAGAVAILIGAHGIGNTQQYERELALVRQSHDRAIPVIPVLLPGCENPPTGFLVTPGEGREDTRARSSMPVDPVQQRIVRAFADPKARLLVTGLAALPAAGPASPASTAALRPTVEVAHEALIRNWGTLRGWLDVSRDKLQARAAILQQQQLWEGNRRRPDLLLQPGFQLERGRALLADPGDVTVEDVADYIQLSQAKDRADAQARDDAKLAKERQVAEAERLAREAAEQARAEAQKRTAIEQRARVAAEEARSRLSGWVIGAMTIAFAALVAGGVATWEWIQARQAATAVQLARDTATHSSWPCRHAERTRTQTR